MKPSLYLRQLLRESRGSRARLLYFVVCLAVGVAAVVAVSAFSGSLDAGIRSEARELLAADLAVSSRQPLPGELDEVLDLLDEEVGPIERTDVRELVTVVAAPPRGGEPGRSQLVELKVIDGRYPFYGELEVEPARPLGDLLDEGAAVVAPDLLQRLEVEVGDELMIGGVEFEIRGTVLAEPDRVADAFTIGPRVFLDAAGLERAGLVTLGSRVRYVALLALPSVVAPGALERAEGAIEERLPGEIYRVESYRDAQPALRRGLDRLDRYLGLVALLSLLIGGVGIAQTVRAWLAARLDALAVLKCLGMRPGEIFRLYLGQAALLGLIGSLAGVALGLVLQYALPILWRDLIPPGLIRPWQPKAAAEGLLLGLAVAVLFSVPPLRLVLRVPSARVLRRDAEPLPGNRRTAWLTALLIVVGIVGLAGFQSGSLELAAQFAGVVLTTALALALAALALARTAGRLPRDGRLTRGRVWLRHGIAALARPGATTLSAIVALGLGLLVVLTMTLVEGHFGDELTAELPEDAPTAFLLDIQSGQWPGVRSLLEQEGASRIEGVPVVMARLESVDGQSVSELAAAAENQGRRWALTREQRLTWDDELPPDNEILDGRLWGEDPRPEVSVEREFAEDLGVEVGSTIVLDVQGVPFELAVTSIREVNWESFDINFYLMVEPGVLDDAPQSRLAAARMPSGREQQIQDRMAMEFPNVTVLRLRAALDKIVALLRRVGWGVRFLGSFTVVAGLVILAGAIAAGSVRRGREVALLKAIGMTRRDVVAVLATEYALVGLVAGVIACLGAGVLAWLVVTRGMQIEWRPSVWPFVAAAAGGVLLAVVGGMAASAGALGRRPIEALREE